MCSSSCLSQHTSPALLQFVSTSPIVGSRTLWHCRCKCTCKCLVGINTSRDLLAMPLLMQPSMDFVYLRLCTLLAPSTCCAQESWCPSPQTCFPDSWTPNHTDAKTALPPKKNYNNLYFRRKKLFNTIIKRECSLTAAKYPVFPIKIKEDFRPQT